MCTRILSSVLMVGLMAGTCFLMTPATSHAMRPSEIETNFYTCPPDKETLADCTWNGMRFCPCAGVCWTEGIADGNYKLVHSESCSSGSVSIGCHEIIMGGWVVVACLP